MGVKTSTPRSGTSPTNHHSFFNGQTCNAERLPRVFDMAVQAKQEIAETMVRQFFTKIDRTSLKRLISKRSHRYFELLLHACSFHTRYQLAINRVLDPLCMFIDISELEPMVRAFESLTFYRDHHATIALLAALEKRELTMITHEDDESEISMCRRLRQEFLTRSIEYHAKSKNHRVEHVLNEIREHLSWENEMPAVAADVSVVPFNPRPSYTLDDMDSILRNRCDGMSGVGIMSAVELNRGQMPDLLRNGLLNHSDARAI